MTDPLEFCEFAVRITPRSSRNKLTVEDQALKAWVTSPPVDGEANAALIKLISKSLGIAPSLVSIIRGETGRDKLVRVSGKTWLQIETALAKDQ